MSIRGLNLFNNPNTQNLMQSLGQNPFPMRGLERFMQKRGMNYPPFPQGGPNLQGPNSQGEAGRLADTLKVQEATEKRGGIKEFLSRFSRRRNK
ncbi:hypothetical protein [Desulfosporosinus shakirovi]|uniref:hypothetical protein n=1 Tax=Desulfosporosinus shakirovi TaxID=2885154 RepID=UPI001E2D5A4D|nr:hypothetical protein [Desulfosporosinus sp. SRJS8]MCB8817196.1 hypothetical protein [Desulfosporosinus sp. SRJS8]